MKHRQLHFVQLFVCMEQSLFKINNPEGYVHGKTFSNSGLGFILVLNKDGFGRSQCPRGLRRWSAASHLLGLRVRTRRGHGCLSLASVACCQVSGFCGGLVTRPKESYRVWCVLSAIVRPRQ